MKMQLDCIPCYFRQAIHAARLASSDEAVHWKTVQAVCKYIAETPMDKNSILAAEEIHALLRETLDNIDPYLKVKEKFTAIAENAEPLIESLAAGGPDLLLAAVKMAIAGNIIDFGAGVTFDVDAAVRNALNFEFAVDHFKQFADRLSTAENILYIGDNTGELYFDKPLLKLLSGKNVTFAVRGGPCLNDATREYALRAGIDKLATIIDTEIATVGYPLERIGQEAVGAFNNADMIIAKGQGNFESLHGVKRPGLFFLMKVKCGLVAKMLGANEGDIIIMESSGM